MDLLQILQDLVHGHGARAAVRVPPAREALPQTEDLAPVLVHLDPVDHIVLHQLLDAPVGCPSGPQVANKEGSRADSWPLPPRPGRLLLLELPEGGGGVVDCLLPCVVTAEPPHEMNVFDSGLDLRLEVRDVVDIVPDEEAEDAALLAGRAGAGLVLGREGGDLVENCVRPGGRGGDELLLSLPRRVVPLREAEDPLVEPEVEKGHRDGLGGRAPVLDLVDAALAVGADDPDRDAAHEVDGLSVGEAGDDGVRDGLEPRLPARGRRDDDEVRPRRLVEVPRLGQELAHELVLAEGAVRRGALEEGVAPLHAAVRARGVLPHDVGPGLAGHRCPREGAPIQVPDDATLQVEREIQDARTTLGHLGCCGGASWGVGVVAVVVLTSTTGALRRLQGSGDDSRPSLGLQKVHVTTVTLSRSPPR